MIGPARTPHCTCGRPQNNIMLMVRSRRDGCRAVIAANGRKTHYCQDQCLFLGILGIFVIFRLISIKLIKKKKIHQWRI